MSPAVSYELADWVPSRSGRYFPGHISQSGRDATISVTRLTESDTCRPSAGHPGTKLAPGGRRVTAGDGNMVLVGHIGHPRQAPHGALGEQETQDRNTGP